MKNLSIIDRSWFGRGWSLKDLVRIWALFCMLWEALKILVRDIMPKNGQDGFLMFENKCILSPPTPFTSVITQEQTEKRWSLPGDSHMERSDCLTQVCEVGVEVGRVRLSARCAVIDICIIYVTNPTVWCYNYCFMQSCLLK